MVQRLVAFSFLLTPLFLLFFICDGTLREFSVRQAENEVTIWPVFLVLFILAVTALSKKRPKRPEAKQEKAF